jgi:hypothetical protein
VKKEDEKELVKDEDDKVKGEESEDLFDDDES